MSKRKKYDIYVDHNREEDRTIDVRQYAKMLQEPEKYFYDNGYFIRVRELAQLVYRLDLAESVCRSAYKKGTVGAVEYNRWLILYGDVVMHKERDAVLELIDTSVEKHVVDDPEEAAPKWIRDKKAARDK